MIFPPFEPVQRVTGTFLGVQGMETDYGTRYRARVRVGGAEVLATMPRPMWCEAGDPVALGRRKALGGYRYVVASSACGRGAPRAPTRSG